MPKNRDRHVSAYLSLGYSVHSALQYYLINALPAQTRSTPTRIEATR